MNPMNRKSIRAARVTALRDAYWISPELRGAVMEAIARGDRDTLTLAASAMVEAREDAPEGTTLRAAVEAVMWSLWAILTGKSKALEFAKDAALAIR